jgi:lysophospholipase L1-like esterase
MNIIPAIIATLALALAGCTTTAIAAPAEAPITRELNRVEHEKAPTPVTIAAVGDSITAWIDRNNVPNTFTWVSHLSPELQFTGEGWAKGGAKLTEMQANMVPVTADVLVILAGTNDMGDRWGTPEGQRLASIDQIVITANPGKVAIIATPPRDDHPEWVTSWNLTLAQFAATRGWTFIDPWTSMRATDGRWILGFTIEGIHPTAQGQLRVGAAISAALD